MNYIHNSSLIDYNIYRNIIICLLHLRIQKYLHFTLIFQYYPYKDKVLVQCTFLENEIPGFTRLHFHETFFTVSYLVPVILLIGLYLTMLLKLWNSGMTSNLSSNSQRGKKRVTRLVVAVVLAFGKFLDIFFLPYIHLIFFSIDVGSNPGK